MKKFEIYQANLNPKRGHVQAGVRPCVVFQSNVFNEYSPTVLIIPLTSNILKKFPGEMTINPSDINGLSQKSKILTPHIMVIDKRFILKKIGVLDSKDQELLQKNLAIVLDWENLFMDD